MQTFILITIVVIATIHLMMASVLSLYSRYKVQYLLGVDYGYIRCSVLCSHTIQLSAQV